MVKNVTRCYGYLPGNTEHDPGEAPAVADAARRVAAGEPFSRIVHEWNTAGRRTTLGNPWRDAVLRRLLVNKRLTGGIAGSPAIIDTATQQAIIARMTSYTVRRASGYLLTQVWCGRCGAAMTGRGDSYRCPEQAKLDDGAMSCGNTTVGVHLLDGHVIAATVTALTHGARLPSADAITADARLEREQADQAWAAHQTLVKVRGYPDAAAVGAACNRILNRRRRAEQHLRQARADTAVIDPPKGKADLTRWIDGLTSRQRQQLMTRMWERVTVDPGTSGPFDAGRVQLVRRKAG